MSPLAKDPIGSIHRATVGANEPKRFVAAWWSTLFIVLAMLAVPTLSHAESRTGSTSAQASLKFRIVIPAIIRVKALAHPDRIVVEDRHIADGYIDLNAGTSVNLTVNSRGGYLLSAHYDPQLLSGIEVRVSNQSLTASAGYGTMRVASGLLTDTLVPIGYRLYLATGVRAGEYRWPVALAFSLTAA